MSTATLEKRSLLLGPDSAGIPLSLREFDQAEFDIEEGWRYELINGVLVVSPPALEMERDPNEELGHWLRTYKETHPLGKILDKTLPEQTVRTKKNRRRADQIIWVGLGRVPTRRDVPSIIAEFVSKGKRNWRRDYIEKRNEYLAIKVQEYWVFDRFDRTLTVFFRQWKAIKKRMIKETETYATALLPGFKLALADLLALADDWQESVQ